MALITCPHCGNQVSDTVERCIHCGELIKEKPPAPRNYADLSMAEKDALDSEYEKAYPAYSVRKAEKKENLSFWLLLIVWCLVVAISVTLSYVSEMQEGKFCETHGIHLQGHYEYSDISDENWDLYLNELETDWMTLRYHGDETILLSEKDYDELQHNQLIFTIPMAVILLSMFILIIFMIVLGVKARRSPSKVLICRKLFQSWLYNQKQIIYHPLLSKSDKKKFDGIDISNYKV